MEAYLQERNIHSILKNLVVHLCKEKPEDAVGFMIKHLLDIQSPQEKKRPDPIICSTDDTKTRELYDNIAGTHDEEPKSVQIPVMSKKRRGAVFSEPLDQSANYVRRIVPKTAEQKHRLESALNHHIMFKNLEEEELQDVFDAMFEVNFKESSTIIQQGDEGDNFYVVDEGECDIFVENNKEDSILVATVGKNGSFGELALIYGCPRAATVKARTDCKLWAIDRATYRHILMTVTIKKRKLYEGFLEKVPILETLTKWERMTVADALETQTFKDGETILKEGDNGHTFFIIVEGEVKVTQKRNQPSGQEEIEIARLHNSDYFGEIALLTNRPRAATVMAAGTVKCCVLDRERFIRVMGPCEDILRRNMENYNRYMAEKI